MASKKDWIRKIKALLAKENGGTQQEVESALKQARRIMKKHSISEREIEESKEEIPIGGRCLEKFDTVIIPWKVYLADAIAKNFRVMTMTLADGDGFLDLLYYGTEDDTHVAEAAYLFCRNAAEYQFQIRKQNTEKAGQFWDRPQKFSGIQAFLNALDDAAVFTEHTVKKEHSYYIGFVDGIKEAMADQNECEALVLVTPALVKQRFDQTFPNSEKVRPEIEVHVPAARLGYEDGLATWKNKKTLKE